MSILIREMEMPKSCNVCRFSIDGFCYASGRVNIAAVEERQVTNYCPLIELPPHGRLIDADAASKQGWTISRTYSATPTEMVHEVKTMTDEVLPTIIEAEKDRRRTSNLNGKCGSCRFFTLETGKECVGYCSGRMKTKGRIMRTFRCVGYEAAPTIIEAEGEP